MTTLGARGLILVIDDDDDIRMALETLLESEGYSATSCDSAPAALTRLRCDDLEPCMILLDYQLPGMSGLDFCAELQRDPKLSDIPVIVYSGVTDIRRQANALGVVHVFRKPLHLNVLVEVVRRYC
jgi:CheY-like chemotaxis protein